MKRIIYLFIACFSVVNLYSQLENIDKKNTIAAHTSLGIGGIDAVGGTPSYLSVGIDYSRKFSDRWSLCAGVEQLGFLGIRGVSNIKWNGDTLEIISKDKRGLHWDITSIPIQFKYSFGNIAYFSFGTAINIFNSKYDTMVGIGWSVGAGLEREFNNNLTFPLNPYVGGSTTFEQAKKGGGNDTRYIKLGVTFGVGYKF